MAGVKSGGVAINALGVCKMAARFKFGFTLKAFRGVESAVTVVESPVLVGKLTSGSLCSSHNCGGGGGGGR